MRTRKDFVEFYSKYNKIDLEEAEKRIDFFIEAMKKALSENEEVIFRKFGSFEVRRTTKRNIVDPKDSSNIIYAEPRGYVKFKVSRSFEEELCLGKQSKKQKWRKL